MNYLSIMIYIISEAFKRPSSSFVADLTDTSRKNVKRMRYE